MNEYNTLSWAVPGKYDTYKNWQLKYELERLSQIYQRGLKFTTNRADERLLHEQQQKNILESLNLICDEMNIRGI